MDNCADFPAGMREVPGSGAGFGRSPKIGRRSPAEIGKTCGSKEPTVTVVVCTRNRPSELDECLGALSTQNYVNYSVLVVDNGSGEPAAAVCSLRGVQYMYDHVGGVSRARNSGARASDSEIVAFTDDDALPEPGWLSGLVEEFGDPAVMAVTGRIRYLTSTRAGRMQGEEPNFADWNSRPRRTFDRSTLNWFSLACFGGIGDGNNMAFRRRAFDLWGGFDERLGRGCPIDAGEEHLAFMSLIDKGHKVIYTPAAEVKHPCPKTAADRRAKRIGTLRSTVAYLCLLWAEFPQHRFALARYVIGSALGIKSIRWRRGRSIRILFHGSDLKAICSGLSLYFRAVRRRSAALVGHAAKDNISPSEMYHRTSKPQAK